MDIFYDVLLVHLPAHWIMAHAWTFLLWEMVSCWLGPWGTQLQISCLVHPGHLCMLQLWWHCSYKCTLHGCHNKCGKPWKRMPYVMLWASQVMDHPTYWSVPQTLSRPFQVQVLVVPRSWPVHQHWTQLSTILAHVLNFCPSVAPMIIAVPVPADGIDAGFGNPAEF